MGRANRHKDLSYGSPLFQEKLNWSFGLWGFAIFMSASLSFSIWVALGLLPTIIATVLLIILLALAANSSALKITVTKGWLIVGPAAIQRAYIHNFQPLGNDEFRRARGVDSDPASYLQIRFWIKGAIKISLRDPEDKTPYWLVSTNRADQLAKVLSVAEH
jgi:hypothetical protein